MKKLLWLSGLLWCHYLPAQDKLEKAAEEIMTEARLLFRSEVCSWYGTDIFLEHFPDRRGEIQGYFSYAKNDSTFCIFFSGEPEIKVIGTIGFGLYADTEKAVINGKLRKLTALEKEYYDLREAAINAISSDNQFRTYENTNYNIIPLINRKERRVFVLTGPKKAGVLIFGNDYLLEFNSKNKLKKSTQLHRNIIVTDLNKAEEGQEIKAGIHSHVSPTSDYITSTDVCTLMLYEGLLGLENYYVLGEKHVSLYNCKSDSLAILTRAVWEKIAKDQETK